MPVLDAGEWGVVVTISVVAGAILAALSSPWWVYVLALAVLVLGVRAHTR